MDVVFPTARCDSGSKVISHSVCMTASNKPCEDGCVIASRLDLQLFVVIDGHGGPEVRDVAQHHPTDRPVTDHA